MNREEAKHILLRCRPGSSDISEPEVAEAIALARTDRELASWLEQHFAGQRIIAKKFRTILVPSNLKDRILADYQVVERRKQRWRFVTAGLAAAIIIFCGIAVFRQVVPAPADLSITAFRQQMTGVALLGYAMDVNTNDLATVQSYLTQNGSPSNFKWPAGLEKAQLTGCAIQNWNQGKVSLYCFQTGRPRPENQQNDLWLFVVDRKKVRKAPPVGPVQFIQGNQMATAIWSDSEHIYLLETTGSEADLKSYL